MKTPGRSINTIILGAGLCAVCILSSCEIERFMSVTITEPVAGSIFDEGGQITFTALITPEGSQNDGEVKKVEWVSDIDGIFWQETYNPTKLGEINITYTFSSGALSPGSHTITCRVRDSLLRITGSDTTMFLVNEAEGGGDNGTDDGGGGDSGDYDFDTCYAMGDISLSATNVRYGNEGTDAEWCTSKITFKNTGSLNIVVMWFVEDTAHGKEKINSDGWLTTSVGPGMETTGIDPAWFSDDFNQRYINTTHVTAYYLDYSDPEWESQCAWIFDLIRENPYGMPPAYVRMINVSDLNPCQ